MNRPFAKPAPELVGSMASALPEGGARFDFKMTSREQAFARFLRHPQLGLRLVLIAAVLLSPCLFLGFYLDDYIGRYIYSNLPGAHRLYELLHGGYGIANGNPADNLWQVEQGYAPWWIYPQLLLEMMRPVSGLTHWIDAWFWPNSAALMRIQNIAWLSLLILSLTRLYRGVLGPLVGGLAALLFAIDHTHAFIIGYICNRHALVTALFGVLCLDQHFRFRRGQRGAGFIAPLFYALALLAGESAVAIAAYIFAYELFVEEGSLFKRALALAPYFVITVGWRAVYTLLGCGARGSGLYIDPGRAPLRFLSAFFERAPLLLFGQFMPVPAEVYLLVSPVLAKILLVTSVIFVILFAACLAPLLKRNRLARFWAVGMLLSLVPATSAHPHNRQLLFASIGAMGLIAQLWEMYALELRGITLSRALRLSGGVAAVVFGVHLIGSPIGTPFAACGIALAAPLQRGISTVGDEVKDRDAIFLTAPDYFSVKLVQLSRRVEQRPLPRRIRTLSYGPQKIRVQRTDDRTLVVDYDGGILQNEFMELYRDRRLPMAVGDHVELQGLAIAVLETTPDGRPTRARFTFDTPLGDPAFVFYYWKDEGFVPFTPPAIGEARELPAAAMKLGLN